MKSIFLEIKTLIYSVESFNNLVECRFCSLALPLTLRICLVADCGRFNCQTVEKFERAKSLAKCSKTAIRYMRCQQLFLFYPNLFTLNVFLGFLFLCGGFFFLVCEGFRVMCGLAQGQAFLRFLVCGKALWEPQMGLHLCGGFSG